MEQVSYNEDEYYFELIRETHPGDPSKGALIVTDGINKESLPKSQIKWSKIKGRDIKIIVPDWLAKDRGFIE